MGVHFRPSSTLWTRGSCAGGIGSAYHKVCETTNCYPPPAAHVDEFLVRI